MDTLSGKATTHIRRKVNELVAGFNQNATNIANNSLAIAAVRGGANSEVVAAAGSTQADAAALSSARAIHRVTGANATVGVILPAGVAGVSHMVLNAVNAVLKVYPASGEKIESGTANAALECTALYAYIFTYVDSTVGWETASFLLRAS